MARRRRPPARDHGYGPGGPRERLAKSRGYRSYYDYRAHDYGRIPPDRPRATGERLAQLRGHRGSADLERALKPGSVLFAGDYDRDASGRLLWVEVRLADEATGKETTYRLRGKDLTTKAAKRLMDRIDASGVTTPRGGSLDVLGLLGDVSDVQEVTQE